MKRNKIIAIYGDTCAGKKYLYSALKVADRNKICNYIVPTVTRPKKRGEEEGKFFHFSDVSTFLNDMFDDQILEASFVEDYAIGTRRDALSSDKWNVGIFSNRAMEILEEDSEIELLTIQVLADGKTRLIRMLGEEDADPEKVCKKFLKEESSFDCDLFPPDYLYDTTNGDKKMLQDVVKYLFKILNLENESKKD